MKVLYFAWVRERIGLPSEELHTEAGTVADLAAARASLDSARNSVRSALASPLS